MQYSDTTRLDWKKVAEDLLHSLQGAVELPDDLGELCEEQRTRETIRLLKRP